MFVLVNLKAYDCDPVAIGEAAGSVDDESNHDVAVAPQTAQLEAVASTGVETWAQHVDPEPPGSHTGSQSAEAAADAWATGTLLNHSEQRLTLASIDAVLDAAERVGLRTVVCANNPEQVAAVAALGPDAVAVEPPELIGTGTPVSQADPDIVQGAVAAAERVDGDVAVWCGAGIATGADVAAARELGASGVLLASGVAKADDPETVLRDLVELL